MSITGSSSGKAWKNARSSWACTSSSQSVGGPRAGDTGGGSSGSLKCVRIFRIVPGSVMNAISRMSPPHAGHSSGNSSPTRAMSLAHAIRDVSCERGFRCASQQPPVARPSSGCPPIAASCRLPTFPIASTVTARLSILRGVDLNCIPGRVCPRQQFIGQGVLQTLLDDTL